MFVFVLVFRDREIPTNVACPEFAFRSLACQSLLPIRRGPASHQLSATALLGSPDGSRHPLDVCEFAEEDYGQQHSNGNGHYQNGRSSVGLWECMIGCRRRLDQHLARRRVSLQLHHVGVYLCRYVSMFLHTSRDHLTSTISMVLLILRYATSAYAFSRSLSSRCYGAGARDGNGHWSRYAQCFPTLSASTSTQAQSSLKSTRSRTVGRYLLNYLLR